MERAAAATRRVVEPVLAALRILCGAEQSHGDPAVTRCGVVTPSTLTLPSRTRRNAGCRRVNSITSPKAGRFRKSTCEPH